MNAVNLIYKHWEDTNRRYIPNLDLENLYIELKEKVEKGEKVYVRFCDTDKKRPGAIAFIKRFEGEPFDPNPADKGTYYQYRNGKESRYTIKLGWEDRKNTAQVQLNSWKARAGDLVYLPDYKGPTKWSELDIDKLINEKGKIIKDRLGNELSKGDVVVYINARYGDGATLDFGTIKEIKQKAKRTYRGQMDLETTVIIETIATKKNEKVMESKIRKPERSIAKINDVDLFDEAFIRKLTVDQSA